MKIPTEEQIEAVTSELLATSQEEGHNHNPDDCDLCKFLKEFNKRGENEPTCVDNILLSLMKQDPQVAIGISVAGVRTVCEALRFSFFVGMKVGIAQETSKQLEDLMER